MRTALIVSLLLAAPGGAALADGVADMCLSSGGAEESCACARAAIDDAFPPESVATYEAVARHYLDSATPETPDGDWDVAYSQGASEMGMHPNEAAVLSNEVGRAHQTAIRLCGAAPASAEGETPVEGSGEAVPAPAR